jgi:hypothetical protein
MYAYWKILQRQEAGRLLIWITPYKRSAVRGMEILTNPRTPEGVQPASGLRRKRLSRQTPCYATLARGYPHLRPSGLLPF